VTPTSAKGLIIAAPASGSGKTLITLALLRALKNAGTSIVSAKVGPDYIDPAFHTAASAQPCLNLDTWAMRPATLAHSLAALDRAGQLIIAEGVMGLFDGAGTDDDDNDGSTASLAKRTGWPVVLIVDARAQAASAAAVVRGFATHSPDVEVRGVIFNRVGSDSHADLLRRACSRHMGHIPVLGCLPRDQTLLLPERHLGLVQAEEHGALELFLEEAANWVGEHVDLGKLTELAVYAKEQGSEVSATPINPLGQRIAVARDQAFAFSYHGVLQGWRNAGAEVLPFSPLAGEGPDRRADSVYLPGGYPELHAGKLSANGFPDVLRQAAETGAVIFGECGGFMVLGNTLIDGDGNRHRMAGLLDVETSFARRKLHLGYRQMTSLEPSPMGPVGTRYRGHEFHYASVIGSGSDRTLFQVENAKDENLGTVGLVRGNVAGSFMHLIDTFED
jgi:cobyrinic acid a,c-diamide synthase